MKKQKQNRQKQDARRRAKRRRERQMRLETLEPRQMLVGGPILQGISVDDGSLLQDIENTAPQEIVFRFDRDQVISQTDTSLAGITLTHGGDDRTLGTADDVTVVPGYIGVGVTENQVVMRFAETLPDNIYEVHISGNGTNGLKNTEGESFDQDPDVDGNQDFERVFRLDLGAQVIAVVPQPITRGVINNLDQARNQIDVYFNNDPLDQASAERTDFYQLRFVRDTATNLDDDIIYPIDVEYDVLANKATLTFSSNIETFGTGSYRLQVGSADGIPGGPDNLPILSDPSSTFAAAFDLGVLSPTGRIVSSEIADRQIDPLGRLDYPGGNDEPGHRDIDGADHLYFGEFAGDVTPGVTTLFYNFEDIYGQSPTGDDLFNLITEQQKELVREILDAYSYYAGLQFIESDARGFTIATGDLRALGGQSGPGGNTGIGTSGNSTATGLALMDAAEDWDEESSLIGGSGDQVSYYSAAMGVIGIVLGLGTADELPSLTLQTFGGGDPRTLSNGRVEPAFPGDQDIVHLRHIYQTDGNDVDLYSFEVTQPGVTTLEVFAERLANSSQLDSQLIVWQETTVDGSIVREMIASNDDYFSEDSFIELTLSPGEYFVGVSSTGNNEYDPSTINTEFGGTSEGAYELRLQHRPSLDPNEQIQDRLETLYPGITPRQSQPLDGDSDGTPGGAFNFWFTVDSQSDTIYVDKSSTDTGSGSISSPFTTIEAAIRSVENRRQFDGDSEDYIIRVVGNGGVDGDLSTLADNEPYVIGRDLFGVKEDGASVIVPRDVTMMIDAGAMLKFSNSYISVGSTAPGVDRSGAALQVLGTPDHPVHLGSFKDASLGGDSTGLNSQNSSGDWGGILFAGEVDQSAGRFNYEDEAVFLNSINHARITDAGGSVIIESVAQRISPIELLDVRATITHNVIANAETAAIAASPDSFRESNFHESQTTQFTSDYVRVGPDIHHNFLEDNSFNAMFIRSSTPAGGDLQGMTVSGRWDDTDIPHVVAENLLIQGTPGGPSYDESTGRRNARYDASLTIDPGTVVKLTSATIELGIGAQLLAEGSESSQVIFTSIHDDRYGGSGTFDTKSNGLTETPAPGDWGGIYVNASSRASIDRSLLAYGGGIVPLEGSFSGFNVIEVHQGDLRLTNSTLSNNRDGQGGIAPATRFGRRWHTSAAIFLRGTQPIIVNNTIENTVSDGPGISASAISVNVNSLNWRRVVDLGRQTGFSNVLLVEADNQGPLIDGNRLGGNEINAMMVRGGTLLTESVWDDTDIVHAVLDEISVPNFHSYGTLRLESSGSESLVVKLFGENAGFTAAGTTLDIDDRIGGSVHVVGHPNAPVVLTSLFDSTVGAGVDPEGQPQIGTVNGAFQVEAGDWNSILLEQNSNDRNVDVAIEYEDVDIDFSDNTNPRSNGTTITAQLLGQLAPNEKSGDENRRLGFDVHGVIAASNDVDVYSFLAEGGTEVWLDIDQTTNSLDSVIELITSDGAVLASSESSLYERNTGPMGNTSATLPDVNARGLSKTGLYTKDHFSVNSNDAGMRVTLPESGVRTYHVRVRSSSNDLSQLNGGLTDGGYELQVRLREVDEIPGSTVKFADIRYATNGISISGLPGHSPLLGDVSETTEANNVLDPTTVQNVGNVLVSDRAAISIAGNISTTDDVDWYEFQVGYEQASTSYASITIDLDYADGAARGNFSFAIYDAGGNLVAFADDANISDDLSAPGRGADTSDLERGSLGTGDAYLGPISLRALDSSNSGPATYYMAVFPDSSVPAEFSQEFFESTDPSLRVSNDDDNNTFVRFRPVDSTRVVIEDNIDGAGEADALFPPVDPDLFPFPFELGGQVELSLSDLRLFGVVGRDNTTDLRVINPFTGQLRWEADGDQGLVGSFPERVGDLAMRPDGRLFSLTLGYDGVGGFQPTDENSGIPLEIDTLTGAIVPNEESLLGEDDGIVTYQQADPVPDPIAWEEADIGIQFEAFTFGHELADGFGGTDGLIDGNDRFYAIGYREPITEPGFVGPNPADESNILYMMDYFDLTAITADPTGLIREPSSDPPTMDGAWTDIIEVGTVTVSNGNITGMAVSPTTDTVFAVTDSGQLIEISVASGTIARQTVVSSSIPSNLTSLTIGPPNLEGGSFSNILFGMDGNGMLHAFNTNGTRARVFAGNQSSIPTDLGDYGEISGIQFSPYDTNIFHSTTNFDSDGHGRYVPVTDIATGALIDQQDEGCQGAPPYLDCQDDVGTDPDDPLRENIDGVLYFGAEEILTRIGDERLIDFAPANSVDFPAGARGQIRSNTFDLTNYDAADQPTLYFNYLADTPDEVSLSIWSNGLFYGTLASTHSTGFSFPPSSSTGVYQLFQNFEVDAEENEDLDAVGDVWRQARIPIGYMAGLSNIQLEFSYSGTREQPDFAGFYLDDIIIGLAERGEVVAGNSLINTDDDDGLEQLSRRTGQTPTIVSNPTYVPNSNRILTGPYQIEIRRSQEYRAEGVIDTNDRLTDMAINILPPLSTTVSSGDYFILSNGLVEVTFEFLTGGQVPSIPDAIPVSFQPGANPIAVGTAIVNALQQANTERGLNITGKVAQGVSSLVELHGDVVILKDEGTLPYFEEFRSVGDQNRLRDQGQIIITSNVIRDSEEYAIRSEAGSRTGADGTVPNPGPAINHVDRNVFGLATGVVIVNNVIARGGTGGIRLAGDPPLVIEPVDPDDPVVTEPNPVATSVPIARVINNTIVGSAGAGRSGVGIDVSDNASPTILNNVLVNLETAILIDDTSESTVVGGTAFQNVEASPFLGAFPIQIPVDTRVFVNPGRDNYYPAPGSPVIDSSIDSLGERQEFSEVKLPLGIPLSPVLAPTRDATGQIRVDDPDVNSSGQGAQVFVDRGALDRGDFIGPTALLINPRDNDSDGVDLDPTATNVRLLSDPDNPLTAFVIQLFDGGGADITLGGAGVNDFSVINSAVQVSRDGVVLTEGVEYALDYDTTNNQIRLVPAAGVWTGASFKIELFPPIADVLGNALLPNRSDGSTAFDIQLLESQYDFGDAPDPSYPSQLASNGARHFIQGGLFLGSGVTGEPDSVETDVDDGVQFPEPMIPGRTSSMIVTASQEGRLDVWFDFDQDGTWSSTAERLYESVLVLPGENFLSFAVPESAAVGSTYARFRLSEFGFLQPTGEASSGEVEDYMVTIDDPGIDFGDAPSTYPTLLDDDGARHEIVPGFYLGAGVDGEGDALASADANGDSEDDGVTWSDLIVANTMSEIQVEASKAGRLDAWIDFNGDQTWTDDEQIFTDEYLFPGANSLTFMVAETVTTSETFARFRFSSVGLLSPTGEAPNGEVEDYAIELMSEPPRPLDYGDAPSPYPTLLSGDGPRHEIDTPLFLGASIDGELNGQPSFGADGDGADDDGIAFRSGLGPDRPAFITVTSSGVGRLNAWIDFNQDGEWSTAEQIFSDQIVQAGVNELSIDVPASATIGTTYARFRLTSGGGTEVTGYAEDGEVEDYQITIDEVQSWHNSPFPVDVNNNGVPDPLDALLIINELDERAVSDPVTGILPLTADPPPFLDVNNDGYVSPVDAVLVIASLPGNAPAAASSYVDVGGSPLSEKTVGLDAMSDQNSGRGIGYLPPSDLNEDPLSANPVDDFFAKLWDDDSDEERRW